MLVPVKHNLKFGMACEFKYIFPDFSYSFVLSETKNQWARDDPAFIVICSVLLVVATLAYCAT